MAEVEIQTERVDDIPLLIYQQQKMGIAEVIDGIIGRHGNRQGLSVGQIVTGWLSYILSQADHRMSPVEDWAEKRIQILSLVLAGQVRGKDFTDDRLGDVLRYLSDDKKWAAIETELGQRLIRVYNLPGEAIRLDSTSVAVYHDAEGSTLFRYGHSKDHRPDLAQFKVMLATLDPLGMPLATLVVPGNEADDGLYIPTIKRARAIINQAGRLYVGDSKMEALQTRAFIAVHDDFYLTPLSHKGDNEKLLNTLLEPVQRGEQDLIDIEISEAEEPRVLGQGYETAHQQQATVSGEVVTWTERVLVIYSPTWAKQAQKGLQGRLQRAEKKLLALTPPRGRGKHQWSELAPLQAEVETILKKHRVSDLLQVTYIRQVKQRHVRKYKDRPARTEEQVRYQLEVHRLEAAIKEAQQPLGWRLYVTNAPVEQFSLTDAVLTYRGAPSIEHKFHRLKGYPLGLRPLYLQREDHAKGMVRLLALALRVLTVTEFIARRQLKKTDHTLPGLYAGNPKRTTNQPTTERLLAAFKNITLTIVHTQDQVIRHITPLSPLQQRILSLLELPLSIYKQLTGQIEPIPP